jgi:hypothetical protein
MRTETSCEIARKFGRVAELYDREARWWEVLVDWTYTKSDLCTVYGAAAIAAKTRAEESAKEYRRLEASYWQRATAVAADSGVAA